MKDIIKKILPDILIILAFAAISFVYFFPADTEGRILYRHDASASKGYGQESVQYQQRTGERTRWTNSIFCGMPTYQMSPTYDSTETISGIEKAYHLWLPENVWYVFVYLLGFYILLRAFNFRQWLAALGAIIWAFSSYFFIIIAAGHIWKVMCLAYIPPTIAGMVLAYRGKYLLGGVVTAFFVALQIRANHIQMSYYFFSVILALFIAFLIEAIRNKTMPSFLKASATCLVAAIIGIAINASVLWHTYEYTQESMRGKSELVKENTANQTDSGLERDYITAWSYGIGETWTLLVPNAKGGASVPLSENATAMKKADPMYYQLYQQLGQYWGEQPGTSGPVYVGAFVFFLFILSLFIVKGPIKWALLIATVLSILLSWGKNFMGFTDFFIDNIPMYSKFRTVASILVVAEFTIPLLAMMALKKIIDDKGASFRGWHLWVSLLLSAGVSLLFAVAPDVLSPFISSNEMQGLQAAIPGDQLAPILANLTEVRKAMLTSDAWRSFFIIVIGVVCIMLYIKNKLKAGYMITALVLLCLIDMWQVNKRYLNDEMFVSSYEREAPQQMTATDAEILKDTSLDYRVLNFASNTFNENETSYYHKSIGGYHAAKLRRYQEVIEAYIAPEMQTAMNAIATNGGDMQSINGDSIWPVLNMLNTKYFILPLQGGQTRPLENPYAQGCAWFVDKVTFADNANQELEALATLDLRHEAVADRRFKDVISNAETAADSSTVEITSYEPNRLTYNVHTESDKVLVFSEVYYPGWTATVDGVETEVARVNYLLRAISIKAGNHKVALSFFPKTIDTTESIAYIALALLGIGILAVIVIDIIRKRKEQSEQQ